MGGNTSMPITQTGPLTLTLTPIGNTYYTPDGTLKECGVTLQAWEQQGNDVGSKVYQWPTDEAITTMAAQKLGIK